MGDKIKSTGGCWSTFFNGKISKVNSDGTYNIQFDDGDKKSGVSNDHIISAGFSVGQSVTWTKSNSSIPKGEVGRVKALQDGEKASVTFLKGTWTFPFSQLRASASEPTRAAAATSVSWIFFFEMFCVNFFFLVW